MSIKLNLKQAPLFSTSNYNLIPSVLWANCKTNVELLIQSKMDQVTLLCKFSTSKQITVTLRHAAFLQGVPEKNAQSLRTTILQPYFTESCGFQQTVQKEIVYATRVSDTVSEYSN